MAKSKASEGHICGPSEKEMNDWQAESDLRTLTDAEKIKSDKDRLKRAMKKRDEMAKNLEKVKA